MAEALAAVEAAEAAERAAAERAAAERAAAGQAAEAATSTRKQLVLEQLQVQLPAREI